MARSNVDTSGDMVLEGYAVLFDTPSEDLGGFKEIIGPHALDDVDIADVKCLINHDFQMIIGRTQAETLELKIDKKGLWFKCYLPDTSYARDIYENVKAGNVTQCSFFYTLPSDDQTAKSWTRDDGEYVQTINHIDELLEISIVTMPAYVGTSVEVGQRSQSLEQFQELEKLKIQFELDALRLNS